MGKKVMELLDSAIGLKESFIEKICNPDRFVKLRDGWIKDTLLGIDWGPSSEKIMDWEAAKKYCEDLRGWLPNMLELITLIDYTKRNPAINPIFADTKTDDWYWSGTPVAGYESVAWIVDFSYGYVGSYYKDGINYVRPVRASQ